MADTKTASRVAIWRNVPELLHLLSHEGQSEDEAITREGTPWDENGIALRLGFDIEPRKGTQGFVFGRDPVCDIVLPNISRISKQHFRIHYNLSSGVLMITDTSTYGTIVGRRLLRRESLPLIAETTICCGARDRIRFDIRIPDRTRCQELYQRNYRQYAKGLGCKPGEYIPQSTQYTQLGPDYSILEEIGRGNFGTVNTVVRNRDGCVFTTKDIRGDERGWREVLIMRRLSHVSRIDTNPHITLADVFEAPHCRFCG